jgi:general secretion pathway protein L
VTLPSLAYLSLMDNLPGDPDAVQAIVDLGHERVTVLVGTPSGGVEWARSFSGGGAELTRALAADFKVPPDEAREWKEKHADLRDRARTPDEEAAFGALRRGLSGVIRELRTTLRAHQARFKKPITAIHLCGGTSQIKGLDALLTRELHLPFGLLALPQLGAAVPAADAPRAALAYALALRGQANNNKARFNLRKGEFGFKSDFEYLKGKLGRLGAYAAVLLLLSGVLGYAKLSSLAAREKVLDAKLCESTQKVLGKCQPDYNIALSMLREHNAPSSGLPQVSSIEILAETTSRIPTETAAKITEVEMTAGRMRLRGTVDSFDSVDKLTASLKTYKCFTNISKGRTEKDPKAAGRIAFTLDVEVNCAPPPQG